MHWATGYGLAGQIMAIWISASLLTVAGWNFWKAWDLRRCRRRNMIRILTEHAERSRQAQLARQHEKLIVADAIAGRQKDNAFLQRARKAEALGFIDPDESGPYVA